MKRFAASVVVIVCCAASSPLFAAETPAIDRGDPALLIWLDASDRDTLTVDADGRVSAWANKAAAGGKWTAAGARRPAWIARAAGGRPAVRFDGVDDGLANLAFGKSCRDATLLLAFTPRSNRGFGQFHGLFSGTRRGQNDYMAGINVDLGGAETGDFSELNVESVQDAPGVQNLRTDSAAFGQPQVIALSIGGGRCRLFVGGEPEADRPAGNAAICLDEVRIGARFFQGAQRGSLDGDVAEVILYSQRLGDDARKRLTSHWMAKYGVRPAAREAWTLDDAFAHLPAYDWSTSRKFDGVIDQAIRAAHNNAAKRAELERRLLAALQSPQATQAARDFVCRRLERIGTAASVPALEQLAADGTVAYAARAALERIPGEVSTAALRSVARRTSGPAQAAWVVALGKRRDGADAAWLESLLKNSAGASPAILSAAAGALAEIAQPSSVDALVALHRRGDAASKAVLPALTHLGGRLLEQKRPDLAARVFAELDGEREPAWRALALDGLVLAEPDKAAARLAAALAGDQPRLRGQAARILRQSSDERLVAAVLAGITSQPAAAQAATLDSVAGRNTASVREAALATLTAPAPLDRGPSAVRLAALRALAAAARPEDVPRLVALSIRTPANADPAVCEAAERCLALMQAAGTDDALARLLAAPEAQRRAAAVRLLGQRQARRMAGAVEKLAADPDAEVRREVPIALRFLRSGESLDDLVRRFLSATTDAQRASARALLLAASPKVDSTNPRARPLIAAAESADPASLALLLPVLGTLGGDAALAAIDKSLQGGDAVLREAAVRALCNWPDATRVDRLLAVARKPDRPEHLRWAVQAIARVAPRPGQLPPAKAFETLHEALGLSRDDADRRLLVARMAAVRAPECLEFLTGRFNDPVFGPAAIESAAKVAEGIRNPYPREAREALQQVLAATKDPALKARVERLLGTMKR